MSVTHSDGTELSKLDSHTNLIMESPGSDHDENSHKLVSANTKRQGDNTQYFQVPKNRKPLTEMVYENNEPNNKATNPNDNPVTVSTSELITKALKCQLIATLIVTICIITSLSLVPVVLYNINPPNAGLHSIEVDAFQPLIFATCSVSIII